MTEKCINIVDYIDINKMLVDKINLLDRMLKENTVDDKSWIIQTEFRKKNLENLHDTIETTDICDEG